MIRDAVLTAGYVTAHVLHDDHGPLVAWGEPCEIRVAASFPNWAPLIAATTLDYELMRLLLKL
jgi:hypothetical protein